MAKQYCLKCESPEIKRVFVKDKTYYHCFSCNKNYPRLLVVDPKIKYRVDGKRHIHYSAGVFIYYGDKILFFKRTIYPFKYSIPAGHIDTGELSLASAIREVKEEIGVDLLPQTVAVSVPIVGDKCRRGADTHIWDVFKATGNSNDRITVNDEGKNPVFLTKEEALRKDLVYPVRYLLENNYI